MSRRLALGLVEHLRLLTDEIDELTAEITVRVTRIAPSLLAIVGCGAQSAAKIIGETAHAGRFRCKDAFARHNGTAPLPVWSSNKQRHRLSRTGNRQLNAALHRIALTQARCYPPARELLERRKSGGDGGMEALRVLKRRLSDVVYRAMLADETDSPTVASLEELETRCRSDHGRPATANSVPACRAEVMQVVMQVVRRPDSRVGSWSINPRVGQFLRWGLWGRTAAVSAFLQLQEGFGCLIRQLGECD